jgi:hypothetical protein
VILGSREHLAALEAAAQKVKEAGNLLHAAELARKTAPADYLPAVVFYHDAWCELRAAVDAFVALPRFDLERLALWRAVPPEAPE